jgi:hypothetical protein
MRQSGLLLHISVQQQPKLHVLNTLTAYSTKEVTTMANKSNARKRWRKAIDNHVEAVPGSVTKAWSTLIYRLRGEGYAYDKETDFWYYILEEESRAKEIERYRMERASAQQLAREAQLKSREERERKRRERVKLTVISAGDAVDVLSNP